MNAPAEAGETPAGLPLARVALLVEYDGTDFHGMQWQPGTRQTIQGRIEDAARELGSASPGFICAGRTDAGVHATGQVIAINLPQRLPERKIALAMNAILPQSIRVRRAVHCDTDFSPRIDAIMRTYVYRMAERVAVSPLHARFVAFTTRKLDPERTAAAAAAFKGQWELKEWRAAECQAKRTFLTITEARALPPSSDPAMTQEDVPYWRFLFRARSFLHHQVRFMVGAIVAVGQGRLELEELRAALRDGKRPQQMKMEEARGLCLARVEFRDGKNPFTAAPSDGSMVSSLPRGKDAT
ncbi:MAG TPA: tRNA pseudouridine(38-40) synthase TruA [Candidatus Sumerlaeota bacterium]|nr:tRNA pseudouridine(38-40) synthase TruA [Candidatus Sumerlaeota bacterium]